MIDFLLLIGGLSAFGVPASLAILAFWFHLARQRSNATEGLHSSDNANIFAILKTTAMSETKIYHLRLKKPVDGKRDFYFFSLAAIYDHFSEEQIGCTVRKLWEAGISGGAKFSNDYCTIKQELVYRKPQRRG